MQNFFCREARERFTQMSSKANHTEIAKIRNERLTELAPPQMISAVQEAQRLAAPMQLAPVSACDGKVVFRSLAGEINHKDLRQVLEAFMPWKKGPFDFFGIDIDAEWRSDQKWARIEPYLNRGGVIADIGCHNGYYLYRCLELDPQLVVGFEPMIMHAYSFAMSQSFCLPTPELLFEPLGVESIDLYPQFFDQILMLGILYHHTDPMALLRKSFAALRKSGCLIVDCQGIEDERSMTLVPSGRYAGAAGVWHLPSRSALLNWLKRAGFRDIELIYAGPLTSTEQRATPWAPIKSLADFIAPDGQTIEGYPPPWRYYAIARR